MDRSVEFYSKVLSFEKTSDVEVWGTEYEHLQGLFGLRMRVVRMKLGYEAIELTEYLAPQGRPTPVDSRSHDRWFQHIALIVNDMDRAYTWLRQHKVQHASTGPQCLPEGIEFLEYLAPRDGRPYPEDARANDLLHWQTKLLTHNTEAMAKRVGSGEYKLLSPGIVAISSNHLGFRKAITVRDPDGHVMQIVEK
jgi:catechol 2,3-dioxygenase-like lactoylglutathione lyase family enzyme